MDLLSYPLDGWPVWKAPETWFVTALAGGFLAGWGAMIFAASLWMFDAAPEATRRMVLTGLAAWFVVDSSGSLASGNWQNAIWNTLFLVFLIGSLWRPAVPATQS